MSDSEETQNETQNEVQDVAYDKGNDDVPTPLYEKSVSSIQKNAPQETQMVKRTRSLSLAIGDLDASLQLLFDKIEPILSMGPETSGPSVSDRPVEIGQSKLAGYLQGEQMKIEELTDTINRVAGRVEL